MSNRARDLIVASNKLLDALDCAHRLGVDVVASTEPVNSISLRDRKTGVRLTLRYNEEMERWALCDES